MGFEPKDKNFKARVAASFAKQEAMASLGGEIVEVEPGKVVLQMPFDLRFTQQHGFIHAGIITTMLDSAAGYAAFSLMPENAAVLTVEFKTNLMAPAQGDAFRFVGTVLKPGRTITFSQAEAFAISSDGIEKKIATMSATMMTVIGRDDVKG